MTSSDTSSTPVENQPAADAAVTSGAPPVPDAQPTPENPEAVKKRKPQTGDQISISVVVSKEVAEAIDKLGEKSRSEAVRKAIDAHLAAVNVAPDEEPKVDVFALQRKIDRLTAFKDQAVEHLTTLDDNNSFSLLEEQVEYDGGLPGDLKAAITDALNWVDTVLTVAG